MVKRIERKEFYIIVFSLILVLFVFGYMIIFRWAIIGPFTTILASIELGVMMTLLIFIYINRRKIIFSDTFEDKAINRITELSNSLKKLTIDLQNISQEVDDEIEENQKKLEGLSKLVDALSEKESQLKKEIDTLQKTKPEVAQFFISEMKKIQTKDLIFGLILFVAGVLAPYILNFLFSLIQI